MLPKWQPLGISKTRVCCSGCDAPRSNTKKGGRAMGRRGRSCVRPAAIAALLLVTCAGCQFCARPPHGLTVRGDWSLEVNRVPWLSSRAKLDDECSQGGCGFSTECLVEDEIPAGCEIPSGCTSGTPMVAPPGPDDLSRPKSKHEACPICRGLGHGPFGGSLQPAAAMPYRHSRFHPVPTRPVFRPQPEQYVSIEDAPDSGEMGPAQPVGPQRRPAPVPSEFELIPTPAPRRGAGWEAKDGQR